MNPSGATPPRVLLVTDADLSAGSRGAGRTLVNLLRGYPAGRLLAVSGSARDGFTMDGGHTVLPGYAGVPGRVNELLRPRLGDVDAAWNLLRPLAGGRAARAFAPEVVLACPTLPVGLSLAARYADLAPDAPLVTYLMDDWMSQAEGPQHAFDVRRHGDALLRRSRGWLMISRYLHESVRDALGADRPTLVVHNPVTVGTRPAALDGPRTGRFRVAYAGSIWPMHDDAVKAVASSVARLRAGGADIEMVVHTDRFFWGRHADEFTRLGVIDGGLLPYDQLFPALAGCDLLVVASSFEPSQAHMSRSSVQTKVTDCMAAGRPILACGPSYAASNRFLAERDCAILAEDPSAAAMDAVLQRAMAEREAGVAMARRAFEVVQREHSVEHVTGKLHAFLGTMASGA